MSQLQQDSPIQTNQVWVLRESFLAYERFHGVFSSKEAAKASLDQQTSWAPIRRSLPSYMWDEQDPFSSDLTQAESWHDEGRSLFVVEPLDVKT